jgi:hypothetical protein
VTYFNRNNGLSMMVKKSNKFIFSSILFLQALSLVYSMTALEEPYEYIQCTKRKAREIADPLNDRHLRSSRFTRESGTGFRKLVPRSQVRNDDEDYKNNGKQDCITLILCDHGDEFNHWTDDCHGRSNVIFCCRQVGQQSCNPAM